MQIYPSNSHLSKGKVIIKEKYVKVNYFFMYHFYIFLLGLLIKWRYKNYLV